MGIVFYINVDGYKRGKVKINDGWPVKDHHMTKKEMTNEMKNSSEVILASLLLVIGRRRHVTRTQIQVLKGMLNRLSRLAKVM